MNMALRIEKISWTEHIHVSNEEMH